ncbi:hypothetical protein FSOLCH5_007413 [Fusarium solani]|uniref:Uncharacterized protein n=1 Tax=Fusarium solani TaxID=169388 RepID=A0A9P9HIY5_FUSSL|nr:uncharacterized protein B0J15DRAFT_583171 [Fusarium solani]KAH7258460.1 hypothetical protein B0J15DRAFT_583171 [Fusarium solani]KAJ4212594.1 hypothetical protein NW759_011631 [Fusarium solani]
MRFYQLFTALAASTTVMAASSLRCSPFPSSMIEFSSGFVQPEPPLVKPEFKTNFVQHKWNENLSHITTGFIDNSPSKGFVRADEAFDGKVASSLFNYANVTKSGLVDNTLTTYTPGSSKPEVWRGYVNSNFPIFQKDILVKGGAVFEGLVQRKFIPAPVAAWSLMYQDAIPVTVYVDNCHVVVGYDYFSPGLRTRVINEFFNTEAKE